MKLPLINTFSFIILMKTDVEFLWSETPMVRIIRGVFETHGFSQTMPLFLPL